MAGVGRGGSWWRDGGGWFPGFGRGKMRGLDTGMVDLEEGEGEGGRERRGGKLRMEMYRWKEVR